MKLWILINVCISFQIQISGSSKLGYYYLVGYFGSELQPQSLIIDNESNFTIFDSSTCTTCGKHIYNPFDPNSSSTFNYITNQQSFNKEMCEGFDSKDRCVFTESYMEGSKYSGLFGKDNFVLESTNSPDRLNFRHVFGLANIETNLFYTQKVNGILGLQQYNKNKQLDLIQELHQQNKIRSRAISFCFGHSGGFLFLGDWNENKHINKNKQIAKI